MVVNSIPYETVLGGDDSTLLIRSLEQDDVPTVVRLLLEGSSDEALERVTAEKVGNVDDHRVLVGSCLGEVVATIEIFQDAPVATIDPRTPPQPLAVKRASHLVSWISNLYVRPDYRRRRIGRLLVAAAETVACEWNHTQIHLQCDADLLSGPFPFYQSLGYRQLWTDGTNLPEIEQVPVLHLCKELTSCRRCNCSETPR